MKGLSEHLSEALTSRSNVERLHRSYCLERIDAALKGVHPSKRAALLEELGDWRQFSSCYDLDSALARVMSRLG